MTTGSRRVLCLLHPEGTIGPVEVKNESPRALCVGRHPILADHFSRFFSELGIETKSACGVGDAVHAAREFAAEVMICEYEFLATVSIESWEADELLSRLPIIAVSLTRRSHEANLMDLNGIGGFLYLPILDRDIALQVITAAATASRNRYVPAPATTSPAAAAKA